MRLLLLTDGIPPFTMGGMQKHSYLLAEYLAREGVQIELHFIYDKKVHKGLEHPFSKQASQNIILRGHQFPVSTKFPGHYIFNSYRFSKTIYQDIKDRLRNFDFIYVKGFAGLALFINRGNLSSCPPIGVKFHGMNMFLPTNGLKPRLEQFMLRPITRFSMTKADYIFSYGGQVSKTIKSLEYDKSKILEIPTGIESEWLREKANRLKNQPRKIIFIGRYDIVKGIRELSDAISQINIDLEFHFVGPFDPKVQLKLPNVFYHGVISNKVDLLDRLDQMDALILPSYSEGMPNVILEAMARGLAIIATRVGAVELLVDEANGIILKSSKSTSIVDALKAFINLKEQDLLEMKNSSLHKVKRDFKWEVIGKRTINLIAQKC